MSTVNDIYETAKKLIEEGHGDVEVIAVDMRSGDSGSAGLCSGVEEVDGTEDMGHLCDMEPGEKYVRIWMDH